MKFKSYIVASLFVICTGVHGMTVDLYVHKDKFGQSLEVDVSDKECTNVPRPWANLTQSIDTHGSCMQFYDEKSCRGRIAVIQPFHAVHQMDLSLINFDNAIESISPCGPKVQSGRYVIQSAVDASILSVTKTEGQFATAQTLPPRPFIPKAQQWDIEEKQPHEYDIMPRIHEENFPVTYDGDGMKRGSFIRKRWKIESVGRGRYIIRSEWTQKCLYKTRLRRVEENDCRSWSPSQEWVLRPLLTRAKPEEKPEPVLEDGINFQIPSRVVDEHLAAKRREKEEEESIKRKKAQKNNAAYLAPYRIKRKKQPSSLNSDDNDNDEDSSDLHPRPKPKHRPPPKPQVLFAPHGGHHYGLSQAHNNRNKLRPQISYYNGVYPVYDDVKVPDPVFPDFLLRSAEESRPKKKTKTKKAKYAPPEYVVTRRPSPVPYPDLPHLEKPKPKYSSFSRSRSGLPASNTNRKIKKKVVAEDDSENNTTDEAEDDDEGEDDDQDDNDNEQDNPEQAQDDNDNEDDDVPERSDKGQQGVKEVDDDDAAADVASFLKLLFKGISSKMNTEDKHEDEMIDLFE